MEPAYEKAFMPQRRSISWSTRWMAVASRGGCAGSGADKDRDVVDIAGDLVLGLEGMRQEREPLADTGLDPLRCELVADLLS
jgi:hypothetical protein